MSDFEELVDLASARAGGVVLAANDEFFAEKENLIQDGPPLWVPDRYTDRGKWMDGWETRRRREPGHDWCVLRLGLPGVVRGVVVDTTHFRGNYPEAAWLEGTLAEPATPRETLLAGATRWSEILPRRRLAGDARNRFAVKAPWRFSHLRLHIDPDGGVARLRVHGEVVVPARDVVEEREVDLGSLESGAAVVAASDRFFGSPHHLLLPGPSRGMYDGWETRRRRGPGHDWAIVRWAAEGRLVRAVVDTSHFKGNAPGAVAIDLARAPGEAIPREVAWREVLPESPVRPHAVHEFSAELVDAAPATHARLRIFPDGGVARLRLFGRWTERGREALALRAFDTLPPEAAEEALTACLAVPSWVTRLVAARPFGEERRLRERAEKGFGTLSPAEWSAAFAAHPRIGEVRPVDPGRAPSVNERAWSAREQAAAAASDETVRRALAAANRRYEERFGRVFLIRASGRSAEEILAALESRLENDPKTEFAVAVEELKRIARDRMERMLRT
jgi:allantoicase